MEKDGKLCGGMPTSCRHNSAKHVLGVRRHQQTGKGLPTCVQPQGQQQEVRLKGTRTETVEEEASRSVGRRFFIPPRSGKGSWLLARIRQGTRMRWCVVTGWAESNILHLLHGFLGEISPTQNLLYNLVVQHIRSAMDSSPPILFPIIPTRPGVWGGGGWGRGVGHNSPPPWVLNWGTGPSGSLQP